MININLKNFSISNNSQFVLIAGPCVIENESHSLMIAEELHKICNDVGINLIFKSSFDKANRSSIKSERGVAIDDALICEIAIYFLRLTILYTILMSMRSMKSIFSTHIIEPYFISCQII